MKKILFALSFITSLSVYAQKPIIETNYSDTIYITESYSKILFKCYECPDAFIVKDGRKHYVLNYNNECYKYMLFTEKYNDLEYICENKYGSTSKKIIVVYNNSTNEITNTNSTTNTNSNNSIKTTSISAECSSTRCSATTKSGKRCGNYTTKCSGRCHAH